MEGLIRSLTNGTNQTVTVERSLLYCTIVSTGFVGSLFCLVPRRVRALDRDDAKQIKWRAFAAILASLGSMALYPIMIGRDGASKAADTTKSMLRVPLSVDRSSMNAWLRVTIIACAQVLAHVGLLYTGSLVKSVFEVQEYLKHRDETILHFTFWKVYYHVNIQPTIKALFRPHAASERWVKLRMIALAPLVEEVVFRQCIVSALAAAKGISTAASKSKSISKPFSTAS
jgi:hypothetical protein